MKKKKTTKDDVKFHKTPCIAKLCLECGRTLFRTHKGLASNDDAIIVP